MCITLCKISHRHRKKNVLNFFLKWGTELIFKIKEIVVVLTDQGIIPSLASFYSDNKFYVGCWGWGWKTPMLCPSSSLPRCVQVAVVDIIGTNSHFLIWYDIWSMRFHAWYYKFGQKSQVLGGPSGETVTVIMLNSCAVKLPPYTHRFAVLNSDWGRFPPPQWITVNEET